MELPRDEIMCEMAKLAIEQATLYFAKMAREFAKTEVVRESRGDLALTAFANAIENINHKIFPAGS